MKLIPSPKTEAQVERQISSGELILQFF